MVFLFPLIFIIFFTLLKWKHPSMYRILALKEDGIVENLTSIFYFISCFISFSIALKYSTNSQKLYSVPYFALACCFFFIAMEEISWGQRIFGIQTPEYLMEDNYQGEMNIHNLKFFPLHALYIIVGLYGGLSRVFLPKSTVNKYKPIVNYFIPDYHLSLYFLIIGLLYLYYEYLSPFIVLLFGDQFGWGEGNFIHGKDQEPAEFLLSIGFFLFIVTNQYRQLYDKNSFPWKTKRQIEQLRI